MRDPRPQAAPRRPKLALTHTGGETIVAGDPAVADALAHALDVADEPRDRLTHGFHSYPARMHWCTAARVLERLDLGGARLLDPFCGSGTVLIESRVAGAQATGLDLNPLAVRLARVKCDPLTVARRAKLKSLATQLRLASEERVRAREPVRAELPGTELRWYEPHVLKEMAGLLATIQTVEDRWLREASTMVFSSLVIKFSRQRSDTSEELIERRIRKGLVSEFFERKTLELCERLRDLESAVKGPPARVIEGDARRLSDHVEPGSIDVVITSPPYGGTYDYATHHARRFAWLGLRSSSLAEHEIGARRRGSNAGRFAHELGDTLKSMRSVLSRDGLAILLMGDGQHGGERVAADQLIEQLSEDAGFEPLALASQPRPDFHGGIPRYEHLMALRAR
jgi:hypothetical protein